MKLTHKQLLWLYFYLWKIELSLDRAIYGGWEELVEFLTSRNDIKKVLSELRKIHSSGNDKKESEVAPDKKIFLSLYRRFFKQWYLYNDEFEYIYSILNQCDRLLSSTSTPKTDIIISNRMQVYNAKSIIRGILGQRKIKSCGAINHFHHSAHLEVKELENLVGNVWT